MKSLQVAADWSILTGQPLAIRAILIRLQVIYVYWSERTA